ncbi:JAB domain-containing protein [Chryseobacterium sp. HSC-36S06]|uniref:JAB domain-containing protein n=1 Tax=Chryseobacterium sp. HSC-36S06 TaxID=2910970 RepID=UPI00209F31A6|nr:JAB domain-containing protein [Chryseobacterium sp. HSC-36S06]MCP2037324.1 DNA repair protein RadC [Chryseobacterium sp. HSC-36S06]
MNTISEIEVAYRPLSTTILNPITQSKDAYDLIIREWDDNILEMIEEVKVIFLNRTNKQIGIYNLAKGGITGCVVDIRIILSIALKTLATGLILVHNHPSGNLNPSTEDRKITNELQKACEIMNITLLDHLIVTRKGFFSFSDANLI